MRLQQLVIHTCSRNAHTYYVDVHRIALHSSMELHVSRIVMWIVSGTASRRSLYRQGKLCS